MSASAEVAALEPSRASRTVSRAGVEVIDRVAAEGRDRPVHVGGIAGDVEQVAEFPFEPEVGRPVAADGDPSPSELSGAGSPTPIELCRNGVSVQESGRAIDWRCRRRHVEQGQARCASAVTSDRIKPPWNMSYAGLDGAAARWLPDAGWTAADQPSPHPLRHMDDTACPSLRSLAARRQGERLNG